MPCGSTRTQNHQTAVGWFLARWRAWLLISPYRRPRLRAEEPDGGRDALRFLVLDESCSSKWAERGRFVARGARTSGRDRVAVRIEEHLQGPDLLADCSGLKVSHEERSDEAVSEAPASAGEGRFHIRDYGTFRL